MVKSEFDGTDIHELRGVIFGSLIFKSLFSPKVKAIHLKIKTFI
jgi:hypothetical protein